MTEAAQTYDPDERRDTPLALKLKERIRADGPMLLSEYMDACLFDPEHGYYKSQRAIGAAGDFVTAPEISQVFGELVGLWCAVTWKQLGSPSPFNLVELGPGRGTMMRDILRATRIVPGFLDAARVALVETSPILRERQKETLHEARAPVEWFRHWGELPDGPMILVANEYLDAFPVNQWRFAPNQPGERKHGLAPQFCRANWQIRCVGLDERGELNFHWSSGERFWTYFQEFGPGWAISDASHLNDGDIIEWRNVPISEYGCDFWKLWNRTGAALVIDYGHLKTAAGDTLQAVRAHKFEHPLTSPGEADLTTHVSFEEFQSSVTRGYENAFFDGPTTQAEFLGRLGIIERASKLMGANPGKAGEIEAGVMRLMAPNGMGTRFKVIGIRSPDVATLPGF